MSGSVTTEHRVALIRGSGFGIPGYSPVGIPEC